MAQSPQRQAPGRASAVLVFLVVVATTLFGVWREHELARSEQAMMKAPAGGASAPQWIVLMGGTALSFLLYSLFSTQAQLRQEAEFSREKILARDEEITALNRDFEEKINARTTELREANERSARFKAVIESTTDLVAMASFEGRTLYLNQAGRRMMEFPDDLMVSGHEMSKFYPEDVNRFFSEVAIPQAMRDGF